MVEEPDQPTRGRAAIILLRRIEGGRRERGSHDRQPKSPVGKWPEAAGPAPQFPETRGRNCVTVITLAVVLACSADAARAQNPAAQRGLTFVRVHCAQCHAIDRVSDSPLTIAPAFRRLHLRYPVENLAEAFAEGISTGHPTMPQFRLDPGQIGDLLAYLKTLER